MQLELGRYESKKTACDVEKLLLASIGSDGYVEVAAGLVDVDVTVLSIAVEEALSNARKVRMCARCMCRKCWVHGHAHVICVCAHAH